MPARIWLILLCVCAMVSLPAKRVGAIAPVSGVELQQEGPSIESDQAPFPDDMRQSERLEIVTAVGRMLVDGVGSTQPELPYLGRDFAPLLNWTAVWCDLVQCRRQSGAQLLHFATPPPPRG